MATLRPILRSVMQLGSGDFLGRLCAIATVVLLGHRYGVAVVGSYALGMTVSYYLQPLIDFGLRHIGARLMARYPQSAGEIMRRVQHRRLAMAAVALPLTLLYSWMTRFPPEMKVWLFIFSATSVLYTLSLEWAAWGREQLQLVGLTRVFVPLCILLAVLVAPRDAMQVLWWGSAGNACGFLMQALVFRAWWKRYRAGTTASVEVKEIAEALAFRRTTIMGLSVVAGVAFNSIDTLMLGVMSTPQQVGLYGASYRVLNQVLVTYYLLTNVLYPRFARQDEAGRVRSLRPMNLLALMGTGVLVAGLITLLRGPILLILFGPQFGAAGLLLLLLAWAIPLDFLTTYLSTAYAAWGMEKKTLLCTGVAAGSNIVLNLAWIPQYGAAAAAVNTLVSYVIFLAALALAARGFRKLMPQRQPQPEMMV